MTHLLDTVLFCAIGTVLIVRTELWLTNYPQIGGHGLHIAHLLWGGLLMLVAIVILLAFVVPGARQVAAVLGGIGLGLFIDEVGKFVTSDNNYFFKPAATIIYIFFIVFFLVIRQLERTRAFTEREYLLNTIEMVKNVPLMRMGEERRARALELLGRSNPDDPLVAPLGRMLDDPRSRLAPRTSRPTRALARLRRRLLDAAETPGFRTAVITAVSVWVAALVVQLIAVVWYAAPGVHPQEVFRLGDRITNVPFSGQERDFVRWVDGISCTVAVVLALDGLRRFMRGQMVEAYTQLERALLVSIFFTQVFAFVHSQLAAVVGLVIDLVLLITVRTVLGRELERRAAGR